MSRIKECFDRLNGLGRKALIPYITAGDSTPALTVPMMHAMVEAGADIIELGIPFSDPMADGPVIQLACERALSHGVTLADVLSMVSEFRKRDNQTPVVLMGYLNPIEMMGYEPFAERAAAAGVDGVLTVDLPPEEADTLGGYLEKNRIDTIFLVAPTTTAERIRSVCSKASGYIYYVSLKGVTGSATLDTDAVAERISLMRSITDLPLGVGFGIRDGDSAARVSQCADGVVVGSVLVDQIASHQQNPDNAIAGVSSILREMRAAMDQLNR
ncbi:tryptophan synthase subunit alpha [Aestuariirhabdus litorea]|uniref:Tryptophan synthase alpha chain n=1 Tax=Aestuariirhabdus litorea TaxID=2528527 RepID=A0A3P3VQ71_9GAMM|nr:tryptophan synthase subunit alpha [Aestuariirhabdus litorea]RRJ84922.1 tryptophan synthase subunit alpha [Aestuariirhabdus litorea]RWW98147.1 tryptophan synthase subunit alpha [Endozoicomonadaceae bacterium GTF-13]